MRVLSFDKGTFVFPNVEIQIFGLLISWFNWILELQSFCPYGVKLFYCKFYWVSPYVIIPQVSNLISGLVFFNDEGPGIHVQKCCLREQKWTTKTHNLKGVFIVFASTSVWHRVFLFYRVSIRAAMYPSLHYLFDILQEQCVNVTQYPYISKSRCQHRNILGPQKENACR